MLSDIELALIAGFFPRPTQRLLPVIMRQVSYPHEDIYSTLLGLADRGVVDITGIGGTTVYTLNIKSDEALSGYLFFARMRLQETRRLFPKPFEEASLKAEKLGCDIALLCGSYARGCPGEADTPIVVGIVSDTEMSNSIEKNTLETTHLLEYELANSVSGEIPSDSSARIDNGDEDSRYSPAISRVSVKTVQISVTDFQRMKTGGSETFRDMVNFCIPLKGAEQYFQLLYMTMGV